MPDTDLKRAINYYQLLEHFKLTRIFQLETLSGTRGQDLQREQRPWSRAEKTAPHSSGRKEESPELSGVCVCWGVLDLEPSMMPLLTLVLYREFPGSFT